MSHVKFCAKKTCGKIWEAKTEWPKTILVGWVDLSGWSELSIYAKPPVKILFKGLLAKKVCFIQFLVESWKSNVKIDCDTLLLHRANRKNYRRIKSLLNRPWWPSGLRWHAIFQLIVAIKGPPFESRLRQIIYMGEFIWSQFAPAIIEMYSTRILLNQILHTTNEIAKVPRHAFLANVNGLVWAPNPGGRSLYHQSSKM